MKFWWVNQNQTFKQEIEGGYLWSPKRKQNGHKNQFYEYMKAVKPGDIVFSFCKTRIQAIGVINSFAYAAPKPTEFGKTGGYWSDVGWKVDVNYQLISNKIKPAENIEILRRYLPDIYSPIQKNGNGNQGVYLALLPQLFAENLISLIGVEAKSLIDISLVNDCSISTYNDAVKDGLTEYEEDLENFIRTDSSFLETERKSIILARRGQGIFRRNVSVLEKFCRVTKVDEIQHLRASHIKPWRYCDDHKEKLSGSNGLMLTPTVDHLFDRGFITFDTNGEILAAPIIKVDSLLKMGVDLTLGTKVGCFNQEQEYFLNYHRNEVFLGNY
ncbi:HNH endonuclease [Pseudoalteromonas sp. C2R02]|uniref:HNH endonuclease n=1 Tax=Pseudoalteromonas sp. C2R02 TaxID=2841565 RepID=UPI001C092335|nr:HNH endonuclease [Pseudoalteromonas sp. C2R02]MBU2968254.1 HNH endonuclease [Pseudoalteromonas sp. C2R02]